MWQPQKTFIRSAAIVVLNLRQVRAVLLDEIMAHPDAPNLSCVVDYETRSLRRVAE
jgi:hypothetical protein